MAQLMFRADYHRTQSVKLAHTIADLAGNKEIQSVHLAEALQYRPKIMIGQRKENQLCAKIPSIANLSVGIASN
jgi:hypothetical protein